ncbi:hypothetical protein PV327_007421 [Microctonus hyperodae]|uniref:Uncharacterized protein n=1 Tax=Microctonus hyperodae TaxID=165561 RepID=A0AA39KYL8_MICHY|nr:hypothetical protein PV327_007421 [Microctonus hyperodae]
MSRKRLIAWDPNTELAKSRFSEFYKHIFFNTRERLMKQPSPKNTSSVILPGSDSIQQKDFAPEIVQNVCNFSLSTNIFNNSTIELKDCCKKVYNEYVMCNILLTAIETYGCRSQWNLERKYRITENHGLKFESVARQLYFIQTDAFLYIRDCELLDCPSEPCLAYYPDGVINNYDELFRLLVMKCPCDIPNVDIRSLHAKCKRLLRFDEENIFLKNPHVFTSRNAPVGSFTILFL